MILKPGDCIRLYAGTKDDRPGVVMRLSNVGWAVIATGTTTDRSGLVPQPVFIDFPSWEADQMGLTDPTWFTNEVEIVRPESAERIVQRYKGRCPPEVFFALEKLIYGSR